MQRRKDAKEKKKNLYKIPTSASQSPLKLIQPSWEKSKLCDQLQAEEGCPGMSRCLLSANVITFLFVLKEVSLKAVIRFCVLRILSL